MFRPAPRSTSCSRPSALVRVDLHADEASHTGREAEPDRVQERDGEAMERVEETRRAGEIRPELREPLDDLHDDDGSGPTRRTASPSSPPPAGCGPSACRTTSSDPSTVADRFYVKPLLRTVTFPQAAFVLALSQGAVRLLEISPRPPVARGRVPDLPDERRRAPSARRRSPTAARSARSRVPRARRCGCASTPGWSTQRCARS